MSGLGLLLRHELRSVLRDRRAVVLSVLLPLLVMPLLLLGTQAIEDSKRSAERARTHRVVVAGDGEQGLTAMLERGGGGDSGESVDDGGLHIEPVGELEPEEALVEGDIDAYVTRDEGAVTIHFRANVSRSRSAALAIERSLQAARNRARGRVLADAGFPITLRELVPVRGVDVAAEAHVAGATLGKFLTMAVVLLVLVGGQVVAADVMAGEKERGTLETMLTTAARREDIIHAKLLTILFVALATTCVNLGNLLFCASFGLLPGAEGLAASLPPIAVLALGAAYLPVALIIAALLLVASGRARSFKEAQLFIVPLQFLLIVPALAAVLPGLELRSAVALVPVANASVATREILTGRFDWPMLAAMVAVNLAFGAWLVRMSTRALSEERLISPAALESAELASGPERFQHQVERWVAAVWALLLVINLNFSELDLRGQLAVNLVLLMLGSSVLVVWRYQLDVRKVWALRRPPAMAWPAVLLGVPSGLLAAQGVFWLSSLVLPVPEDVLDQFSDVLTPEGVPTWQIVALATVLPGVCEEIFFRGTLLHGLRKRLGPVALCLVVGAVFGVFHVALFRLVPTAFLGVIFAAATLLTGSIFPAMVWHALNNGVALLAGEAGLDAQALPGWSYAAGAVGLALAMGLLWRYRRVYPDLR